jgi:hypothetical protein
LRENPIILALGSCPVKHPDGVWSEPACSPSNGFGDRQSMLQSSFHSTSCHRHISSPQIILIAILKRKLGIVHSW